MTIKEKAIVMAYTGYAMLTGGNLKYYYKYIDELLGRHIDISPLVLLRIFRIEE